jgi:predicted RNA-binding protein YlxR (DUF448 family)
MGKGKGHVPVRTCVSCGAKKSKADLVRFVLDPGGSGLVQDEGHRLEGRGAYTCKTKTCLDGLRKSKKIGKAFRRLSGSR